MAKKATTKVAAKGKTSAKAEKVKAPGIGKQVIALLLANKLTPEEILVKVLDDNVGAKTTMACIYWYANNQGISLQDRRTGSTKDPKTAEKTSSSKKVQGEKAAAPTSNGKASKAAVTAPRKTPKQVVAEAIAAARKPRGARV